MHSSFYQQRVYSSNGGLTPYGRQQQDDTPDPVTVTRYASRDGLVYRDCEDLWPGQTLSPMSHHHAVETATGATIQQREGGPAPAPRVYKEVAA